MTPNPKSKIQNPKLDRPLGLFGDRASRWIIGLSLGVVATAALIILVKNLCGM